MKPLCYIAGPYTLPDPVLNVRRAAMLATDLVENEHVAVVVPHLSMLWHLVVPADVERWYRRDLDVLEHCDALVRFPGESVGADREVEHATRLSIPVFEFPADRESFRRWAAAWRTVLTVPSGGLL